MRSSARVLAGLLFGLVPALVSAQGNLGDLLDAGATRLSAEQFKREVVQSTIVGRTNAGATLELMYATNGSIASSGGSLQDSEPTYRPGIVVTGEWKIDEVEWICTAMQVAPTYGAITVLPPRCQVWFKLGEVYFISDSDSDRRAKVLRRMLKP